MFRISKFNDQLGEENIKNSILLLKAVLLKNDFNMVSTELALISKDVPNYKVNEKIIMEPGFKSTLFYYYSNRLNFYPQTKNIIIMDIYEDNLNFNQINSLSSNEFYWVLAQNKTEVNKNLQSWIDKQEIFYKIRFGSDDYIYKIRPAKQELSNI